LLLCYAKALFGFSDGFGIHMTDTGQKREDEVLRRMLATKPQPHKPLGTRRKPKTK
jgi:hypothetical protein